MTEPGPPIDASARIGFIGKRLGRFLITAELGRGGMATVYRARDPDLGRDVAIKVMHGFFAGRPELEARFRREANAVATIRHPCILNVFDFAAPAGEEPGYIVSELIDGPGLRTIVESSGGKVPPEIAVAIVARVAEALGAAHAAGIVHRDVKPDNLLVDRSNRGARVVLTDFGVAHISGLDTMTATGAVLGSPAYMSPEQARSEEVGATSDVFSLGVTLYQLCTGHLPFGGKDPLAVITAILRAQFRKPSEIEPRVGPRLEQVILRCLQTSPAARFTNGAAVATALREALDGERRAAGLLDDAAALARFLDDGAGFVAALAPAVAGVATGQADEARRRGQTARALAEVGRALAYVPNDPAARALLDRVGRRQRWRSWRTAGLAAGLVALVTTGGGLAWRATHPIGSTAKRAPQPAAIAIAAPGATANSRQAAEAIERDKPPSQRTASVAGDPSAATPGESDALAVVAVDTDARTSKSSRLPGRRVHVAAGGDRDQAAADRKTHKPRHLASSGAGEATVATGPAASSGAAAPVTAAPSAKSPDADQAIARSPDVQPSPAAPEAHSASLVLRASYGFCEPSLDGRAPSLRANYNDLVPGRHDIYCTMPDGPKMHVTTYDLRSGARASLVIVPGPQGQPIIGKTE